MPKATLLQRMLNKPSQSYSFPPQKDFYSTRSALLKVATGGDLQGNSSPEYAKPAGAVPNTRGAQTPLSITLALINTEEVSSHQLTVDRHGSDLGVHQDDDEENEPFYTPPTSHYSSSQSSPELPSLSTSVDASQAMHTLKPNSSNHNQAWSTPRSRTSSASSSDSVSVSGNQEETWSDTTETADTYSVFSSTQSASTRLTTPVNSDHGHVNFEHGQYSKGSDSSPRPPHVHLQRSSKRAPYRKMTYTDEDWAKEVRWLVPPESSVTPKSTRKRPRRSNSAMLIHARTLPLSLPDPPKSVKSRKDGTGNGRMTSVLEVSEDEDATPTTYSYSRSSSFISYAHRHYGFQEQSNLRVLSQPRSRSSVHGQQSTRRSKSKSPSPSRRYSTIASSPLSVPASSEAPSPPSRGTTPYSSLTLPKASLLPPPHAGYSSSARNGGILVNGAALLSKLKIEDTGKVDMTRSGMASTTMATIEVVKGSAEKLRGRRINRPFSWRAESRFKGVRRASIESRDSSHSSTRSHLLYGTLSPLGFCSHQSPPTYVPSNHLLVQVWAVGLDERDGIVVRKEKTGFIPGRSFVGRVVETGWDVRDDYVRKGEWVIGLTDVKKCGALSEFLVVERHRVHRVFQPMSTGVSSEAIVKGFTSESGLLTTEELALLPLCGVFAYRAVKTFESSVATSVAPSSYTRKRVVVLEGHQGTGALSVQMLIRKGWKVVVQMSSHAIVASGRSFEATDRRLRSWGVEEVCPGDALGVLRRMLDRCETEGYVVDGVLDTIGGTDIWLASQQVLQRASRPSMPEVQAPVLSDSAGLPQFTTLVGDEPDRPVPTAQRHFKAGLRSLKRAMAGHGVACAYSWISVGADIDGDGLDIRHALAGIIRWVEDTQGKVKPWIGKEDDNIDGQGMMDSDGKIVAFENTPQVFAGANMNLLNGGTVVVKVVG